MLDDESFRHGLYGRWLCRRRYQQADSLGTRERRFVLTHLKRSTLMAREMTIFPSPQEMPARRYSAALPAAGSARAYGISPLENLRRSCDLSLAGKSCVHFVICLDYSLAHLRWLLHCQAQLALCGRRNVPDARDGPRRLPRDPLRS